MERSIPTRFSAVCLVSTGLALAGCSEAGETPLGPQEIPVQVSYAPENVDVIAFAGGAVVGSSQLVRTSNGVNYRVQTSGLIPGDAYTLWLVIFNDPGECIAGCDGADLAVDAAKPDMMYAAGGVVGSSGSATFSGSRHVGDDSGSLNEPVGLPAYGLEDPSGAEIWLIVHDHGPVIPTLLPDMIQTVDGGCVNAGIAPPWNNHQYGRRGPNTCQSVQGAFHLP
jgi:hypothetical protein